jgi:hypothetical protein
LGAAWEPTSEGGSRMAPSCSDPPSNALRAARARGDAPPTGCADVTTDGTTIAMHSWSPLNDRQLALLTRIGDGSAPVTSDSPELAVTARALKGRGLITMPKQGGSGRRRSPTRDASTWSTAIIRTDRSRLRASSVRRLPTRGHKRPLHSRRKPWPHPRPSQRPSAPRSPNSRRRRKSEPL